jgi:hypothetical protein
VGSIGGSCMRRTNNVLVYMFVFQNFGGRPLRHFVRLSLTFREAGPVEIG